MNDDDWWVLVYISVKYTGMTDYIECILLLNAIVQFGNDSSEQMKARARQAYIERI